MVGRVVGGAIVVATGAFVVGGATFGGVVARVGAFVVGGVVARVGAFVVAGATVARVGAFVVGGVVARVGAFVVAGATVARVGAFVVTGATVGGVVCGAGAAVEDVDFHSAVLHDICWLEGRRLHASKAALPLDTMAGIAFKGCVV